MSERRAEEAIFYYSRAIELDPSNAGDAGTDYGIALAAAAVSPRPLSSSIRSLEGRAELPRATTTRGWLWMMQGNREEAIGHFRQALWLRPDFTLARHNLDNALGNRNPQAPAGPPGHG